MHEMSLCQNIMEIIDQQQKKHEIHEVTDIWLEIGALSCVEQSAVEFCFEIMRKDTVAENCQLHFIHLPAIAWCWRSEEHTSELQSRVDISYAVFCLKKSKNFLTDFFELLSCHD